MLNNAVNSAMYQHKVKACSLVLSVVEQMPFTILLEDLGGTIFRVMTTAGFIGNK